MNFLIFIWNTFVKFISFIIYIALEIFIFKLIVEAMYGAGLNTIGAIFTIIFTIWLLIDIILRLTVGTAKSLIHYILKI